MNECEGGHVTGLLDAVTRVYTGYPGLKPQRLSVFFVQTRPFRPQVIKSPAWAGLFPGHAVISFT
jgi:hypothetical protein